MRLGFRLPRFQVWGFRVSLSAAEEETTDDDSQEDGDERDVEDGPGFRAAWSLSRISEPAVM